jgi:signal transduction histidine kinase
MGDETRQLCELFRLVLEDIESPIIATGLEGDLLFANPAGSDALHSDEGLLNRIGRQLAQSSKEPLEVEVRSLEGGARRNFQISSKALHDDDGHTVAMLWRPSDSVKPASVEQGTLEQRLFESEKLAALGRLAATVAHEINNPLEAILNALYLVESHTPSDDPNRIYLDIANREAKRVSGIVRQMLGLYRTRATVVPVDVNTSLRDSAGLLERQLWMQHVTVAFDLTPGLPLTSGSPDQMKQVFMNLILNAAEAMPDGGTVGIRTRRAWEDGDGPFSDESVLITITDSGMGIPDEHLPNIFEPFYSTKHGNNGSGLGLWVSLGMVQNFGGQISVQTKLGHGTSFTVSLPVRDEYGK